MLGSIWSVWGTSTETYILDSTEPSAVRVYTSAGEYLRQVGRRGEGPGEYIDPLAVAVGPAGNVFVLEAEGGGAINVYGPNAQYLHTWKYPATELGGSPFFVDDAGDVYAYTGSFGRNPRGDLQLQAGFTRIGADGTVHDPVWYQPLPEDDWRLAAPNGRFLGRVPFAPRSYERIGPHGLVASGHSSTNEVSIASRDAPAPTVIVVPGDPIPISRAEARYYRASRTIRYRRQFPAWVWSGREIPEFQPIFSDLRFSMDSRLWVRRQLPGAPVPDCTIEAPSGERMTCWRSQGYYYDVFSSDAAYLGEVRLPAEISYVPFLGDDFLLAEVEDEDGNVQVVRYALVVPQ